MTSTISVAAEFASSIEWHNRICNLCKEKSASTKYSAIYEQIFSATSNPDYSGSDAKILQDVVEALKDLLNADNQGLLSILNILRTCRIGKGISNLPGIAKRLGDSFFKADNLNDAIAAYENAKFFTSGVNTPAVILASLYFKRALDSHDITLKNLPITSANDLGRAYANRMFVFELCRIYFSNCELNISNSRPVKLNDIIPVANKALSIVKAVVQDDVSSVSINTLKFCRDASRIVNDYPTFVNAQAKWMDHYYNKCKSYYESSHFDECLKLSLQIIDILPNLSENSLRLSHFYHLVRLCYTSLGMRNEARLYGQLSTSIHFVPLIDKSNEQLIDLSRSLAVNSEIVIAYLSEAYIDLFIHWFDLFELCKCSNLVMIALDFNASLFLQKKSIPHILRPMYYYQDNFHHSSPAISDDRVRVVADLVSSGLSVLLTGVDSLWLKNPFVYFKTRHEDIVSMGGATNIKNWPVCLNADLFYVRSTAEARSQMPRLLEYNRFNWDQDAFCFLTSELDFSFQEIESGAWSGTARDLEFSLHVLSASFATRDINSVNKETYIFQPPPRFIRF